MVARAPRKRMYKTMQGRMVDIEKLRAANEDTRAVGNMNVNARGDVMGPGGEVATTKAKVMQTYYEAPKGMVDDTPSRNRPAPIRKTPPAPEKTIQKMTPIPQKAAPQPKPVAKPKPVAQPVTTKTESTPTAKKGIDAALDGLE